MSHKKITDANGFRAMAALTKAANDPRVQEIEGGGMEEGRVFIHLLEGWWFGPSIACGTKSVGSSSEIRDAMALIEERP